MQQLVQQAIVKGDIAALEHACRCNYKFTLDDILSVVHSGYPKLARYFEDRLQLIVRDAIQKGDIITLEMVRRSGYAFCPTDTREAAQSGNLKLLHWFQQHGFSMGDPRWRHSNGIPWSSNCASMGALSHSNPHMTRQMLTDLQRPKFGAIWNPAQDVDDVFRKYLVQKQPKGQSSLLVLPSHL